MPSEETSQWCGSHATSQSVTRTALLLMYGVHLPACSLGVVRVPCCFGRCSAVGFVVTLLTVNINSQPSIGAESAVEDPTAAESQTGTPPETDTVLAGHSYHGDAFNEGPRQRAYVISGTGQISFPVSSQTPGVRQFIEQGIGQLHGFWYFEAERSFRHAAMLDPECAIAYWGMAMANENNQSRANEFIEQAVTRAESSSPREAHYVYALRDWLTSKADRKTRARQYVTAMTQLAEQYPEDLEAQAFRGLAMYKHRSDLKLKYDDVEAALQAVLAENPMHPVHHYRIHLWDYKAPKKALDSARVCGASSARIAHMWHMPGHIYSRLQRYGDAVWQQEASSRVDHAQMMRDNVMPDQIHNFAHNNEWLIRNLMYLGRHRDAEDLARNMISLPRHPKYNKLSDRHSAYYGRQRLFEVLYRYERWRALIAACEGPVLEPTDIEREQIRRLRYLGVARARCGEMAWAEVALSDLQSRLASDAAARQELKEENESRRDAKQSKAVERKYKEKKRALDQRIRQLESAVADIRGQMAWFVGDYANAAIELKKVHENKDDLLIAIARAHGGQAKKAIQDVEKHIRSRENQVLPQAALVELLAHYGPPEKLRQEFERLRDMSASVQFGSPVFDRINAIAAELDYTGDWRRAFEHPADFGERPALRSLGPFRWQPTPAPMWELPDSSGLLISSSSFTGRPVIVVFFLGHGCLHCAEQLGALMPRAEEFRAAGIDLVAISSDDVEGLRKSISDYGADINVDLLSDENLAAFRDYRAFDDFENVVLHGTFLIDAQGLIRWQDISYEPFMDIDFLLQESQRLLAQKVDARGSIPTRQLASVYVVRKVATTTPPRSAALERSSQPSHVDRRQLDRLRNGALMLAGRDLPATALERFAQLAAKGRSRVAVLRLPGEQRPSVTDRVIVELERKGLEVTVGRGGHASQDDDRMFRALAGASGVWLSGDMSQATGQGTSGMIDGGLQRVIRRAGVVGGCDVSARWLADRFLSADVTFSSKYPATAPRQDRLLIDLRGAAAITIEHAVGSVSGEPIGLAGERLHDGDLYDLRAGHRVFSE